MLSGAVSVPLFTNISSKNLKFQISNAALHTVFIQTDKQEKIILEADSTIRCIDIDTTDPKHTSLTTLIERGRQMPGYSPASATLSPLITSHQLAQSLQTVLQERICKGLVSRLKISTVLGHDAEIMKL